MSGPNLSSGELIRKFLFGGGMTAGAVITYELFELAKSNPRVLEIALSWGPLFVIAILGMVLVDRRVGDGVAALKENAAAQASLSAAVQKIAEKDDRQADELRRLTTYNAVQSEKIMARLDRQDEWLQQVAEAVDTKLRPTQIAIVPEAMSKGAGA